MTAVQTTYSENIAKGYAGQIASMSSYEVDSKIALGAIPFGVAVCDGNADRTVMKGKTLSPDGAFAGISVRDVTQRVSSDDTYADGDNVGVLVEGDIWVQTAGAVNYGDLGHFASSTGALSASGGTTITNSRWMTTAGSGEMAILRLTAAPPGA